MNWRLCAAVLAALALPACSSGKLTDLEDYAERVKAREPQPIEPLPEIKQVDTFTYEAEGRRDPFVMDRKTAEAVPAAASDGIAPDPLRRKEELEQFSLDTLRMLGSLEQDGVMWGIIGSADGTLYRVRAGNYMGMNNGQIIRISEEEIELTEIVMDRQNSWRERQATIALSQ